MNNPYTIVLIQFPLDKNIHTKTRVVYPLGLSYIAGALNKHNVTLFDPNVHENYLCELKSLITKVNPDIIGVSIRVLCPLHKNKGDLFGLQSFLRYIKSIAPSRAMVCAGGCGFSLYARRIMEYVEDIDFGIFLDGIESFPELLENLDKPENVKGIYFRKHGAVVFSGEREKTDFGNYLFPHRKFLNLALYRSHPFSMGVRTKIGCAFHCSYCSYIFLSGNSLYLRPVKDVINEIEHLTQSGINSLSFTDNVFNFPKYHAEDICQEIIRRNLKIRWKAYFHLKYVDGIFLSLAKKAGCAEFHFSPDGFSQKTLKVLQKGISVDDIVASYDLCVKIKKIKLCYNFIINLPQENIEDFLSLLRIIFRMKKARIHLSSLSIDPFTKLYNTVVEHGIRISGNDSLTKRVYCKKPLVYGIISKILKVILITRLFIPRRICDKFF